MGQAAETFNRRLSNRINQPGEIVTPEKDNSSEKNSLLL
jgi:hypothetical protein